MVCEHAASYTSHTTHAAAACLQSLALGMLHLRLWVPAFLWHTAGSHCHGSGGCERRWQLSSDEAGHGSDRSTVQAGWRTRERPLGSGCRFLHGPTELQRLDAAQPGSCTCRAAFRCRPGSQSAGFPLASGPWPPIREDAHRCTWYTASTPCGPHPVRRHSDAAGRSWCRATQQPVLVWLPSSGALPVRLFNQYLHTPVQWACLWQAAMRRSPSDAAAHPSVLLDKSTPRLLGLEGRLVGECRSAVSLVWGCAQGHSWLSILCGRRPDRGKRSELEKRTSRRQPVGEEGMPTPCRPTKEVSCLRSKVQCVDASGTPRIAGERDSGQR